MVHVDLQQGSPQHSEGKTNIESDWSAIFTFVSYKYLHAAAGQTVEFFDMVD